MKYSWLNAFRFAGEDDVFKKTAITIKQTVNMRDLMSILGKIGLKADI